MSQRDSIGMVFLLVAALFIGAGFYDQFAAEPESVELDRDLEASVGGNGETAFNRSAVEDAAVAAINDARVAEGRTRLQQRSELRDRARSWSEELARRNALEHDNPQCAPGGENVAQTYWQTTIETDQGTERYTTETELGEAIAQQWLTSPSHRENIMSADFSATGIGVAQRDDAVFATQRLCG